MKLTLKLLPFILAMFFVFSCGNNTDVSTLRYGKNLISVDSTILGTGTVTDPFSVNVDSINTALNISKEYKAVLTGANGVNPTVVVTKNDLGAAIVWTRTNEGEYEGTLSGAFPAAKTTVFVSFGNGSDLSFHAWRGTNNVIEILSSNAGASDFIGDLHVYISVEP